MHFGSLQDNLEVFVLFRSFNFQMAQAIIVENQMETPKITQNKPREGKPVNAPANSKFGITGLILGIPSFGISGSTLLLIYIIGMAGGGLDIMMTPTQELTIISVLYCSLFFGIVGGILGVVGLTRGENKIVNTISIMLGMPTLCSCSAIALFRLLFGL